MGGAAACTPPSLPRSWETEYTETFTNGAVGSRGGGSSVTWSSTTRGNSGSTVILGKFDADTTVDFKIPDGMPPTPSNVSLVVRFMGDGSGSGSGGAGTGAGTGVGTPAVTVLGHGVLADVAGVGGGTGLDAYLEYTYLFEYGGAGAMSVRLGSKSSSGGGGGGGGSGSAGEQWAISKVEVKSHVVNYAPSVSDKSVTVSANAADGSGTIELPASDAECDAVTVQVVSLPTVGWTQADELV